MDGMSSAALLVHSYNVPLKNIMFVSYDEKRLKHLIKKVKLLNTRKDIFIFSDFMSNDTQAPMIKNMVRQLKRNANIVIWLDHHPWSDYAFKSISRYCDIIIAGENRYMCGAELVYAFLCKNDRFGNSITKLAHTSDFGFRSKSYETLLRRIASAIKYSNNMKNLEDSDNSLRKIVYAISRNDKNDGYVKEIARRFILGSRMQTKMLLSNLKIINVNGIKIGIGFGEKLQTQEICMKILDRFKTNIAVYIDLYERRAHMRSNGLIHCSKLAVYYGGGGHDRAAGFLISKNDMRNRTEKARELMIEKIRKGAEICY
jgi:oligoribonuclease NrnB/cAMP/cGMP phosphodiesterase (DHH superfamily)